MSTSTLEQFIKMRDGISNPINKATQAVNKLYLAEEQMANSTLKAEQSMENMANGVKNNIAGINKTIPYTIGQLEALGAYQDKLGRWHGADGKYLKVNIDTIQAERNVSSLKESIESLKDSLTGSFIIGSISGDMIFNAIEEIASIPSKLIKASDAYSGIMARLNLVAGGQEQAIALNEQIYQSALRARGPYDVMADSVSKIAMTAKEAFPDPRTVVPFMENIQKLFNIGGTDIERQKDALLQLTQALGSGKLQGDELRSIAEAAPLIEKYIADYMGVSMGEIKQLGADGEITAEIIKNAILGATDEINKQFETILMKWEDIWTNIQSRISHAFQPVYVEINKLANSSLVKSFANNLVAAATIGANAINGLINNIKWLNNEFDNFYNKNKFAIDTIMVGFGGAISVLGLYGIALASVTTKTAILGVISKVGYVLQFIAYVPTAIKLIRTLGIVQTLTAMSAAEMWGAIFLPIGAVVAGVYILTDGFNNLGVVIEYTFSILLGMLTSAGIALGGYIAYLAVYNGLQLLATAYTFAYNTALVVTNTSLSIAYARTMAVGIAQRAMAVASLLASGAMAILNAVISRNPIPILIGLIVAVVGAFIGWQIASNGLRNTLANVFGEIAEFVANSINFMIEKINGLISAFNAVKSTVNEIFGTNLSATSEITYRANPLEYKSGARQLAYNVYDTITNPFENLGVFNGIDNVPYTTPEIGNIPSYEDLAGKDDTAKNTKDTADNTKKIAEAMDIMDEDLKFMRDIAEQEVINKYTTAKIEINMENINNISKDVDFDGIITHIGEQIAEATANGAEAVHI
ncbi:tape measure protein [Megamonas rupellensis]|uniref:tape measure protein n=1 Tax=Megamonas rupellensis TaxID=491921 RepID=UPI001956F3D9|nr:tape measure protein [Megamonas rupellensis]MBM6748988.1 tape measure protein [Megamonas rupellensis]